MASSEKLFQFENMLEIKSNQISYNYRAQVIAAYYVSSAKVETNWSAWKHMEHMRALHIHRKKHQYSTLSTKITWISS